MSNEPRWLMVLPLLILAAAVVVALAIDYARGRKPRFGLLHVLLAMTLLAIGMGVTIAVIEYGIEHPMP
jgi:hypothetical protein